MASTGQWLDGKFHLYLDAEGISGALIEHFGTLELPQTSPNELTEHQSDVANRKDVVSKDGYENNTVDVIAKASEYFRFRSLKKKEALCTCTYLCGGRSSDGKQQDGGFVVEKYLSKIVSVNGLSGDVADQSESFQVEFANLALLGTNGADGTATYDLDIPNPAKPTAAAISTGTGD